MNIRNELIYLVRHPGEADIKELEALANFIKSPTKANKDSWLYQRLRREKRKYIAKGIPREKWPPQLQALEEEKFTPPIGNKSTPPSDKGKIQESTPLVEETKSTKRNDPFSSDTFGELQGEREPRRSLVDGK
jgi:hypothetical protein